MTGVLLEPRCWPVTGTFPSAHTTYQASEPDRDKFLFMVNAAIAAERRVRAQRAKEFLISQIVEEAQRENVPLSEVERKMLYFTETEETLPDIYEVSAQRNARVPKK